MYQLSQDLVVELNGNIQIINKGTVISEVSMEIDQIDDSTENKMLSIIQDWVNQYKSRFTKEGWDKIIRFLQPAIDAIHAGDLEAMKSTTVDIAKRSEKLAEVNPKAKNALDQIHSLYTKLLGIARGVFGEDVDELIDIINEARSRPVLGLMPIKKLVSQAQIKLNSMINKDDPIYDKIKHHLASLQQILTNPQ